jgi:hypothetical protein
MKRENPRFELTAVVFWIATAACASNSPPKPIPLAVSAEADSALRVPCEATIRGAATLGRRVYREKEADTAASLIFENRGPKYPGESGTVETEFVVDSAGRADMATLRPLLPASAVLFASIRDFLPSAKFKPARIHGLPVNQCVNERFEFVFPGEGKRTSQQR